MADADLLRRLGGGCWSSRPASMAAELASEEGESKDGVLVAVVFGFDLAQEARNRGHL